MEFELTTARRQLQVAATLITVILLTTVPSFVRGYGSDSDQSKYKTGYACEGRELEISCDSGSTIHLMRANYGRYSISICNDHGNLDWKVDCSSPKSLAVISSRCNSKERCSVAASSDVFSDPCPNTRKYLEVQYQCISPNSSASSTSNFKFGSSNDAKNSMHPFFNVNMTSRFVHFRPPSGTPITESSSSSSSSSSPSSPLSPIGPSVPPTIIIPYTPLRKGTSTTTSTTPPTSSLVDGNNDSGHLGSVVTDGNLLNGLPGQNPHLNFKNLPPPAPASGLGAAGSLGPSTTSSSSSSSSSYFATSSASPGSEFINGISTSSSISDTKQQSQVESSLVTNSNYKGKNDSPSGSRSNSGGHRNVHPDPLLSSSMSPVSMVPPGSTSPSLRHKASSHPSRSGHGDTGPSGNGLDKSISWFTTPAWLNDKEQKEQNSGHSSSSGSPEDAIISPVGSGSSSSSSSSSSSNPNIATATATSDASNSIVTSHLLLVAISSLVSVIFAFLTLPLLMKSSRLNNNSNDRSSIYKNLTVTLIVIEIILVIIIYRAPIDEVPGLNFITTITIHVLLLTLFMWILMDCIRVYCWTIKSSLMINCNNSDTLTSPLSLTSSISSNGSTNVSPSNSPCDTTNVTVSSKLLYTFFNCIISSKSNAIMYIICYGVPIVTVAINCILHPSLYMSVGSVNLHNNGFHGFRINSNSPGYTWLRLSEYSISSWMLFFSPNLTALLVSLVLLALSLKASRQIAAAVRNRAAAIGSLHRATLNYKEHHTYSHLNLPPVPPPQFHTRPIVHANSSSAAMAALTAAAVSGSTISQILHPLLLLTLHSITWTLANVYFSTPFINNVTPSLALTVTFAIFNVIEAVVLFVICFNCNDHRIAGHSGNTGHLPGHNTATSAPYVSHLIQTLPMSSNLNLTRSASGYLTDAANLHANDSIRNSIHFDSLNHGYSNASHYGRGNSGGFKLSSILLPDWLLRLIGSNSKTANCGQLTSSTVQHTTSNGGHFLQSTLNHSVPHHLIGPSMGLTSTYSNSSTSSSGSQSANGTNGNGSGNSGGEYFYLDPRTLAPSPPSPLIPTTTLGRLGQSQPPQPPQHLYHAPTIQRIQLDSGTLGTSWRSAGASGNPSNGQNGVSGSLMNNSNTLGHHQANQPAQGPTANPIHYSMYGSRVVNSSATGASNASTTVNSTTGSNVNHNGHHNSSMVNGNIYDPPVVPPPPPPVGNFISTGASTTARHSVHGNNNHLNIANGNWTSQR